MEAKRRPRVLVLFGGRSEEHGVSVKSAAQVAGAIDVQKYEPVYVGITKTGGWRLCEGPCSGWETAAPHPVAELGSLRIDAAFPVLHGKFGEDGSVQGLFELFGIPYVGCGIASSAICMDKALAYAVAGGAGIATPEHKVFAAPCLPDADAFTYPVFVKPARSGSSFGVKKATSGEGLAEAAAEARRYDSKIIVEQAIVGHEVGCAVIGGGAALFASEIDQIRLSHGFFRIHQELEPEKGSENASVIVPADLLKEERARIQETAKAVYRALGCEGLARVDMFLEEGGRIVLGEVNTLPGFTSYSRYPRMMAASGVPFPELIDRLIGLALAGGRGAGGR